MKCDTVIPHIIHQRRHKLFHPKQTRRCRIEFDGDILQHPPTTPSVTGQIHGLLWSASTFNRHRRLRENRLTAFELFNQLPRVRRQIKAIVGRHSILAKRFAETRDSIPVQGNACRYNQSIIGQNRAVLQHDLTRLGSKKLNRRFQPDGAFGNQVLFPTSCLRCLENTATYKRPARLIKMLFGRLDNTKSEGGVPFEQTGRNGKAARTTTNNQNLEMPSAFTSSHSWSRYGLQTRFQSTQINTGTCGFRQNLRSRTSTSFRKRPDLCCARSRATIANDWSGK